MPRLLSIALLTIASTRVGCLSSPARGTSATHHGAKRLSGADKPTVWSEFGALARETGAVNLGQGFPDWEPPQFVLDSAMEALGRNCHQYTRTAGHPSLVEVLAERYSQHLERRVCGESEVAVTVGASQALFLTLQALVNPGDEVVLMEPAFDLYYGQIRVAGATSVGVPMSLGVDGEWTLDTDALRAALTPQSRVLILNSPHNPTGKVFSLEEMEALAEVVRDHPSLIVISDEVYKYTVHGAGASHHHFATLDGMFERTVTVSSAGKTFSVTGWQVGWAVGPRHLITPIHSFLPYAQFCVAAPMQEALAIALRRADEPTFGPEANVDYYTALRADYARKRDALSVALSAAGIRPLPCKGGFFMMGDVSALEVPAEYLADTTPAAPVMPRDWALCRYLAKEHGVLLIPASPFFSAKPTREDLVRVAFCKKEETLAKALSRLTAFGAASSVAGRSDGHAASSDVTAPPVAGMAAAAE